MSYKLPSYRDVLSENSLVRIIKECTSLKHDISDHWSGKSSYPIIAECGRNNLEKISVLNLQGCEIVSMLFELANKLIMVLKIHMDVFLNHQPWCYCYFNLLTMLNGVNTWSWSVRSFGGRECVVKFSWHEWTIVML